MSRHSKAAQGILRIRRGSQERIGFYTLTSQGDHIFLADLLVLPKSMGKGIGRQLFEHSLNRASQRGFASLEIEADPNAEGFYLRMGASRVGEKLTEVGGHPRVLPKLVCRCAD